MKISKETRIKLDKIRKFVVAFFLGKRCACCGEIIETHKDICGYCNDKIIENINGCEKCGQPKSTCVCKRQRFEFDGIISPYLYDGAIKDGIKRMKKDIGGDTAEYFADVMSEWINLKGIKSEIDLIVTVPLTKEREREKGYNQSGLLAKRMSKNLDIPYNKKALIKVYSNKEQHYCSAIDRVGNVLGVYEADEEICNDKNILLVDDVTTGGSTLNECAKMLKIAGAKKVYCAVAALTVKNKPTKNADE
ncbi:MAG: ComF family protein [Clostridia bacterium]|nr:ComF family protein [Clostridia bacterium]